MALPVFRRVMQRALIAFIASWGSLTQAADTTRQTLWQESRRQEADGNISSARKIAQTLLEQLSSPADHPVEEEIATRSWLAQLSQRAGDDIAAIEQWERLVAMAADQYGPAHITTRDFQSLLRMAVQRCELTSERREELRDFERALQRASELFQLRPKNAREVLLQLLDTPSILPLHPTGCRVSSLLSLSRNLAKVGEYRQAIPLAWEAQRLLLEENGWEDSVLFAEPFALLAEMELERGNLKLARNLATQAASIAERRKQIDPLTSVTTRTVLAAVLRKLSLTQAAFEHYRSALEDLKLLHGRLLTKFSDVLTNLAAVYHDRKEYDLAESCWRERLAMNDVDTDPVAYVSAWVARARSRRIRGQIKESNQDFEDAEKIVTRDDDRFKFARARVRMNKTMTIQDDVMPAVVESSLIEVIDEFSSHWGAQHPNVAELHFTIAEMQRRQGKAAQAIKSARISVESWQSALGNDQIRTLESLALLARCYQRGRRSTVAESIYKLTYDRLDFEDVRHKELAAEILDGLGLVAFENQDFPRAIQFLSNSIEMGQHPSDGHVNLGRMISLTAAYSEIRDAVAAARIASEVITRSRSSGPIQPVTVRLLCSAANVLTAVGELDQVLPLINDLFQYCESHELSTEDRLLCATTFASVFAKQGRMSEAYDVMHEAVARTDFSRIAPGLYRAYSVFLELRFALGDTLGAVADHAKFTAEYEKEPRIRDELSLNQAKLMARLHAYDEIEPALRHLLESGINLYHATTSATSELSRLRIASRMRFRAEAWLAVARSSHSDPELYERLLPWKGLVFQVNSPADQEIDSAITEMRLELSSVTRQLARSMHRSGIDKVSNPSSDQLAEIEQLAIRRDTIDRKLRELSSESNRDRANVTADFAIIQNSLEADDVFLDFWSIRPQLLHYELADSERHRRTLCCFMVTRNNVKLIQLGDEQQIQKRVESWREAVEVAFVDEERRQATTVYDQVWRPILAHLQTIPKRLYICPEGPIVGLPWGALPGPDVNSYLIESTEIISVPTPVVLSTPPNRRARSNSPPSLLLIGNVDYHAPEPRPISWRSTNSAPSADPFPSLPATEPEIDQVESLFKAHFPAGTIHRFDRRNATETAFREHAEKSRIVHLATHGFFAPQSVFSESARYESEYLLAPGDRSVRMVHPGLSAALALASDSTDFAVDDGLVTALEVQEMSIPADLIVLSACETGVGVTVNGEGVFGLQRAFHMAGARHVVASLWAVEDRATARFFTKFYELLWTQQLPPEAALRAAQIWMLRESRGGPEPPSARVPRFSDALAIDPRRRPLPATDSAPRNWAGFVSSISAH